MFLLVICLCTSCQEKTPLQKALSSSSPAIQRVMSNPNKYEVQIIFSEIQRDSSSRVQFIDDEYQVNDNDYFYPASTVKLPLAILALEKINEYGVIGKDSQFQLEQDSIQTSVNKEINKSIIVSDNNAYNRLFEFVGKDEINERLHSRGIRARISHRLSTSKADDTTSKSIVFKTNDSLVIIPRRGNSSAKPLQLSSLNKGKGYIENGQLFNIPKDFSKKNYVPLRSLHSIMKRLIFPSTFPKEKQFKLRNSDRIDLLRIMEMVPRQYGYDPTTYPDNYVKFFVIGDQKGKKPKHLRIFNKVGLAYGYLIDCAYIKNELNQKEYLMSASVYVNDNQIFNDDIYEYDDIGIPFLAELGRQLIHHSGKNEK